MSTSKHQLYQLASLLTGPESDNDADALIEAFGKIEADRLAIGGALLELLEADHVYGSDSAHYLAHELREDVRAMMRGDLQSEDHWTWWPGDLIREVTEWHDAGRPNAEETVAMVKAGTFPKAAPKADEDPCLIQHDWVYGEDGSQTIRECTQCHTTERVY